MSVPISDSGVTSIAIADVDHDGGLDLVVISGQDVCTLFGLGDGTFRVPATCVDAGVGPTALAVGDFDGNGWADLAVADPGQGAVNILHNTSGTFSSYAVNAIGGDPEAIVFFTGTGPSCLTRTLAIADKDAGLISAWVFSSPTTLTASRRSDGGLNTIDAGYGCLPSAITTGAYESGGKPDLAVACSGTDSVFTAANTCSSGFAFPGSNTVGLQPMAIVSARFSDAGTENVAVANYGGGTVSILYFPGYTPARTVNTYFTGIAPISLATGNFSGTGHTDIAVANHTGGFVGLLLNDGDGGFPGYLSTPIGHLPHAIAAGDFNGDGLADIATANEDGTVTILLRGAP